MAKKPKCLSLFQCPNDLLEKPYPPAVLDQWLAAFIMEARKGDRSYYTPSSLNCLLAGFQRHLRLNLGRAAPNIIDKKNNLFPKKRNALDQQLRCLRKMGIGIAKRRAPVITEDQETQLWDAGVIGFHSPEALLNAIFFYNGKNFCLRGIVEHKDLRFSQINPLTYPPSIQYCEHGSKNNQGGLLEQSLTVKSVTINAVPGSNRCHYKIFQSYLARVPPKVVDENQKFYLQPTGQLSKTW